MKLSYHLVAASLTMTDWCRHHEDRADAFAPPRALSCGSAAGSTTDPPPHSEIKEEHVYMRTSRQEQLTETGGRKNSRRSKAAELMEAKQLISRLFLD